MFCLKPNSVFVLFPLQCHIQEFVVSREASVRCQSIFYQD